MDSQQCSHTALHHIIYKEICCYYAYCCARNCSALT